MNKRKVVIYKYERVKGKEQFNKIPDGNGFFHQFGVDYIDLDGEVGNYSTAIVEMPDGSIRNVPVENIVFND